MPTASNNPVFPTGSKVSFQAYDQAGVLTGTPANFLALKGTAASAMTRSVVDVTTIMDTEIKRRPGRLDPGTCTLTLGLMDVPAATNEWTVLKKFFTDGTILHIVYDIPGTFDEVAGTPPKHMFEYDGFISSHAIPAIDGKSEAQMEYEIIIQKTNF